MIVITNDTGAIDSQDPNTYIIPMPEGETVEIMNEATGEHQILVPDTAQFIPVYNKFDGKQAIQIKDEMAQIQDRPSIIDSEELTQQQDPLTKQQEEGLSPSEQAGPLLQKEPGLERVVIIEKSC